MWQIAFNIVIRGYCLDPPSPPLDCVHLWGPPLIATVSDTTLVTPLRQPALNLTHLILACDTSALLTLIASPTRLTPLPLGGEEGEVVGDERGRS